jgi:hypothetical protein
MARILTDYKLFIMALLGLAILAGAKYLGMDKDQLTQVFWLLLTGTAGQGAVSASRVFGVKDPPPSEK